MGRENLIKQAYEAILNQDFAMAIACFEQAIAIEPDNADFHYKLSVTYTRSNRSTIALEHAEIALALEPDNEIYKLHLQRTKAIKLIEQAEKYLDPNHEDLPSAVRLLKQATGLDPLTMEGFMMLGLAYAGMQCYPEALAAIDEALLLEPMNENGRKLIKQFTAMLPKGTIRH